ncbi:calcium-dependent lipid-binding family protein [Striga asiatica]|uniref:Calcium-dependent lipid-binding family protein n=1 Tax=Striga asiatica TaxID=4170 RepID=A0A5A7R825_STRAF|nr:calcium-dependent lipid-binding family protein [Striga asiatica]
MRGDKQTAVSKQLSSLNRDDIKKICGKAFHSGNRFLFFSRYCAIKVLRVCGGLSERAVLMCEGNTGKVPSALKQPSLELQRLPLVFKKVDCSRRNKHFHKLLVSHSKQIQPQFNHQTLSTTK